MCVICVSEKGVRQPNEQEIRYMWSSNPHGAGYMFARDGKVEIHKGFMDIKDFLRSVNGEGFTADDVVVYHFRISTQAGVTPEMTHPFPLSGDLEDMKILDCLCDVGIAHNGIIHLTSNNDKEYSDTALFVADYLSYIIRDTRDITDKHVKNIIKELAGSKLVLLNGDGELSIIGEFYKNKSESGDLLFSNMTHAHIGFRRTWNLTDIYGYRKAHA